MGDFDLGISYQPYISTDYNKQPVTVKVDNVIPDENGVQVNKLENQVDIKNISESGITDGSFDLGLDEVDEVQEVKQIDPKILMNQLKESLSTYVLLLIQASMMPEGSEKKALVEKAKDLLKEYAVEKQSNPSIGKEIEAVEKTIFKTGGDNKILLGEIDSKKVESFLGIKKETALANQANKELEQANQIDKQIKKLESKPQSLLNSLELQKLQIQKSLHLVQGEINKNLALGIKESDSKISSLVQMRAELRQSETKTSLSIELNKLQNGANPLEIQKNLQKIGDTWYVKNDLESKTQYQFTLAQAKIKSQDFNGAVKLYEEIKKSNPEQALTAQISIVSAKSQSGLFNSLPLYQSKFVELKQKQKEFDSIGNKNSDEAIKLLREITQIKTQFGSNDQIQNKINSITAEQNKLLGDIDSSFRTNSDGLKSSLLKLEKSGDKNTPEYNALKEELESLEDKKHLSKASIYEKQGNNLSAIREYESILGSKTLSNEYKNEILLKISANYLTSKSYDKALEYVDKSKKFANDNMKDGKQEVIARSNMLGASILLQRDSEKSIDLFDDDTKAAIELYKESIKSLSGINTPDAKFLLASSQLELAKVYYSKGDFKEGDKLTNNLVATNKDFKNASLFVQGNAYLQENKAIDAFKSFDKILKESPNSPQAQLIKKELGSFMVNGRLEADKVKGKNDLLAAAQVALNASGSNHLLVSVGLAAGGAAAGAAIGACFAGVGAIPGALIGLAVGTVIDRVSGIVQGSDEISQAYTTGYENITALQNVVNVVGLALDLVDIIPIAGALGKVGAVAVKQTIKAGTKAGTEIGEEALENVLKKTTKDTVKEIQKKVGQETLDSKQLSKMFFEDVDKFSKVFTNSKFAKAQLGVGGVMVMTPGTIQVANAISEYSKGNIDAQELQKQLLNAGGTTVKSLASIVALGLVMGKVQDVTLGLDKITKGISVEMSGASIASKVDMPTKVVDTDIKLKNTQDELKQKGSEGFARDLILNANIETFNNLKMFAKDILKDMDYGTFVKNRNLATFQTPLREHIAKFVDNIKIKQPEALDKVLKTLSDSPTYNKVNELLMNVDRKVLDNLRNKYPSLKNMSIETLYNKINTDPEFRHKIADDISKSIIDGKPTLNMEDITSNPPLEKTAVTKAMIQSPPKNADEMKKYVIQTIEDMMKLDKSAYSSPRRQELQNIITLIKDGKIEIKVDQTISSFAKVNPAKDSKYISINFNPNQFDAKFTDEGYIAHEILHVATPMSGVSDNIREAFTEYTATKLFPRDKLTDLNYDKLVGGLDKLLDNAVTKADYDSLIKLEKLFSESYSTMTPAEFSSKIKTDPSFKEDVKLRTAEFLMSSKDNNELEIRLSNYFKMDFSAVDMVKKFEIYFKEAE